MHVGAFCQLLNKRILYCGEKCQQNWRLRRLEEIDGCCYSQCFDSSITRPLPFLPLLTIYLSVCLSVCLPMYDCLVSPSFCHTEIIKAFIHSLRASAMLKHVIAIAWTSVRPTVRPSHASIVSKRLNILSCFLTTR